MSVLHKIEYGVARAALAAFRAMNPVLASNVGGAIVRGIGPLIPVSRVAGDNLARAMPELDAAARRRIVRKVWDNLGRNVAEFPHLAGLHETAAGPGYEVVGAEHARALAVRGGPAMVLVAHVGNWELFPAALHRLGVKVAFFYRAAANPAVDRLVVDLRQDAIGGPVTMFAKGGAGARASYGHLARGGIVGMLVDQKLNDGIAVPLFGRPAMTGSALAVFARKFDCPILPVHVERLGPARLRVVIEPVAYAQHTGDKVGDIAATTLWMNQTIERWVRARPGEWLWLHRRWPKNS